MKSSLAHLDNNYYTFCAKRSQVIIVSEAGWEIPKAERKIFLSARSQRSQYQAFLRSYLPEDGETVEYSALDQNYFMEGTEKLRVRFCAGPALESRVTEEITIKKNAKSRQGTRIKHRNFLFVTDGVSELKIAIGKEVTFRVINFQQLYVDPRQHIYATPSEIISPEDKQALFGSNAMKGLTCTQINQKTDPLSIFMGLERGDVIREYHSNVYAGHPVATINYRIAR